MFFNISILKLIILGMIACEEFAGGKVSCFLIYTS